MNEGGEEGAVLNQRAYSLQRDIKIQFSTKISGMLRYNFGTNSAHESSILCFINGALKPETDMTGMLKGQCEE